MQRARTHHGVVSRPDLDHAGATPSVRAGLVRRGLLERRSCRVYRLTGAPETTRQAVLEACIDLGGAATRGTAAWLHGIDGFKPPKGKPEVVCSKELCQYRSALTDSHSSTVFGGDVFEEVDGIPTLRVPWVLFSLAAEIPGPKCRTATKGRILYLRERLRNAIDDAIRMGLTTDAELRALLERIRCRGRNGVREFEAALDERLDAPTESDLERVFLGLLDAANLPRPEVQQLIAIDGEIVAHVDFKYEGSTTIIEVSGHRFHSSREQRQRDTNRQNELALAGYKYLEFTWLTMHRSPHQVIAKIRRLLEQDASP